MPKRAFNIETLSVEQIRILYEERLRADFPPDELKPLAMIERGFRYGTYICLGAVDAGGEILAYAFFVLLKGANERCALVDYYAVRQDLRDTGIGSRFLRAMIEGKLREMDCVLLEVDDPDDALAARLHGPGFNGKTEMWYVVDAAPGAHLFSGLSKEITPEQYEKMVEDGSITDALARYDVHPGDVFFLPAGRIHAICSGCFIAEIQQTSDLTYRIYDYKRLGLDGKPRQLHTEQAKLAIDYRVLPDYRTRWQPRLNERVELVKCKYFTTSIFDLTQAVEEDLSGVDSFVVVMCIEGSGTLSSDGSSLRLGRGTTVLVPAENKKLRLVPEGKAKFICSWIG